MGMVKIDVCSAENDVVLVRGSIHLNFVWGIEMDLFFLWMFEIDLIFVFGRKRRGFSMGNDLPALFVGR